MKVVVQRVSQASVDVVNELGTIDPTFEPQQIGPGFMLLWVESSETTTGQRNSNHKLNKVT